MTGFIMTAFLVVMNLVRSRSPTLNDSYMLTYHFIQDHR